jgi:hypothetical protein
MVAGVHPAFSGIGSSSQFFSIVMEVHMHPAPRATCPVCKKSKNQWDTATAAGRKSFARHKVYDEKRAQWHNDVKLDICRKRKRFERSLEPLSLPQNPINCQAPDWLQTMPPIELPLVCTVAGIKDECITIRHMDDLSNGYLVTELPDGTDVTARVYLCVRVTDYEPIYEEYTFSSYNRVLTFVMAMYGKRWHNCNPQDQLLLTLENNGAPKTVRLSACCKDNGGPGFANNKRWHSTWPNQLAMSAKGDEEVISQTFVELM